MSRSVMVAAIIVVLGLGAVRVGTAAVQAGAPQGSQADQVDKEKLIDLMKAQIAMQSGEHQLMHEIMDNLLKKYPNDPEIKALDDFHEKWHSRARMQEELQEQMQTFIESRKE